MIIITDDLAELIRLSPPIAVKLLIVMAQEQARAGAGQWWAASYDRLIDGSGMARRSVARSLAFLEERGHLERGIAGTIGREGRYRLADRLVWATTECQPGPKSECQIGPNANEALAECQVGPKSECQVGPNVASHWLRPKNVGGKKPPRKAETAPIRASMALDHDITTRYTGGGGKGEGEREAEGDRNTLTVTPSLESVIERVESVEGGGGMGEGVQSSANEARMPLPFARPSGPTALSPAEIELAKALLSAFYPSADHTTIMPSVKREMISPARALASIGARPEQVAGALEELRRRWPNLTIGPGALVRHWSSATMSRPTGHRGIASEADLLALKAEVAG